MYEGNGIGVVDGGIDKDESVAATKLDELGNGMKPEDEVGTL